MKTRVLLSLFILSTCISYAQTYNTHLSATLLKNYETLQKGSKVLIKEVKLNPEHYEYGYVKGGYCILVDDKHINVNGKLKESFDFDYKNVQDFWDAQIISNVLYNLSEKGIQNDLRSEMENDALEYISRAKSYNLELNDPYLENYIYSLIAKIAPANIIDGRPCNINLLLLDDPTVNASIFPNGTLVINTGLLSCLHSEDELAAVLSHEIAHFILDHSIQNVNKNISRQKRAEFWAMAATTVTAVAEGIASANNKYYTPGAATLGVALLSSAIAAQVIDRLGMKYNHKQETKADEMAKKVLSILNYDENSLYSALHSIQESMNNERGNAMYFDSYTHPALVERISKAGTSKTKANKMFEKDISFAITSTARLSFENRRFKQSLNLVSQNIANGVGTSEDYILKANCLLALKNNTESNKEVIEAINIAKNIDPSNINIHKTEILAYLRLRDKDTALNLLQEYSTKLDMMKPELKDINSDNTWDQITNYINTEKNWSKRMQVKLNGYSLNE